MKFTIILCFLLSMALTSKEKFPIFLSGTVDSKFTVKVQAYYDATKGPKSICMEWEWSSGPIPVPIRVYKRKYKYFESMKEGNHFEITGDILKHVGGICGFKLIKASLKIDYPYHQDPIRESILLDHKPNSPHPSIANLKLAHCKVDDYGTPIAYVECDIEHGDKYSIRPGDRIENIAIIYQDTANSPLAK